MKAKAVNRLTEPEVMVAAHRATFPAEQAAQPPAAANLMFRMRLADPAHKPQFRLAVGRGKQHTDERDSSTRCVWLTGRLWHGSIIVQRSHLADGVAN